MTDIAHFWSNDLQASPAGDLALVQPLSAENISTLNGNDEGTQRIYRRLMTGDARNGSLSGEDIFAPEYGGGVPETIGDVMNPAAIQGKVLTQMYQEQAVARTPVPAITFTFDLPGSAFVDIKYINAQTGLPVSLTFDPNS